MAARIFRATFKGTEGSLEEIKKTKGGFGDERAIQDLIEENLSVIFPDHEFVKREFVIANQRIDTVAFNIKSKTFVLIEYKKNKMQGAIEQVKSYLSLMTERKADFLQLYHEKRAKNFTKNDIAWDKSRAIIISPSFTEHQLSAARGGGEPVELYQIIKYENGVMTLNDATHQKQEDATHQKQEDVLPIEKTTPENVHLKKASTETHNLYNKLKADLVKNMPNLKIKSMKYVINMVNEHDKIICTVEVRKKSLELSYTTKHLIIEHKDRSFVQHMVRPDGTKIGSRGSGHYRSKIENENGVTRAIRYVKQVHDGESKNASKRHGHGRNLGSRSLEQYSEEGYLSTHGSNETRALYRELRGRLGTNIPGVGIKATVRYIGWRSSTSGRLFCVIEVLKKSLNVIYITGQLDVTEEDMDFVKYMVKNGKKINMVGGHSKYRSKIISNSDIVRAIPYIIDVYMQKEK